MTIKKISFILLCGDVERNPGPIQSFQPPSLQNLDTSSITNEPCLMYIDSNGDFQTVTCTGQNNKFLKWNGTTFVFATLGVSLGDITKAWTREGTGLTYTGSYNSGTGNYDITVSSWTGNNHIFTYYTNNFTATEISLARSLGWPDKVIFFTGIKNCSTSILYDLFGWRNPTAGAVDADIHTPQDSHIHARLLGGSLLNVRHTSTATDTACTTNSYTDDYVFGCGIDHVNNRFYMFIFNGQNSTPAFIEGRYIALPSQYTTHTMCPCISANETNNNFVVYGNTPAQTYLTLMTSNGHTGWTNFFT